MKPVVEVLAELAAREGGLEVAVGSRDHANVRVERTVPPQPLELALLQYAQELGLDAGAHLSHLVQEQDAARGLLDRARPGGERPREGPLLVAEQLRLQQRLRQRGAVERDERTAGPGRAAMDETGDHFLAGARLSRQQHRRLGGRDLRGLGQGVRPPLRLADHASVTPRRRQLLLERLNPLLELSGPRALLRGAPLLLGEPLMRQREAHVVGDAPGHHHVLLRVLAGGLGEEGQRADDASFETQRDLEQRAYSQRAPLAAALGVGLRALLGVADDVELGLRLSRVLVPGNRCRLQQLGRHRLSRDGVHADLAVIGVQRPQHQPVVGQHRPNHGRDLVEDLPHVEDVGQQRQQGVDGVKPAAAGHVQVPQALMLEGQGQEVGDREQRRLVLGLES